MEVFDFEGEINTSKQNNLSIMIAKGPFSFEDSLRYTALLELVNLINKSCYCDLLILMGPLLDVDNI